MLFGDKQSLGSRVGFQGQFDQDRVSRWVFVDEAHRQIGPSLLLTEIRGLNPQVLLSAMDIGHGHRSLRGPQPRLNLALSRNLHDSRSFLLEWILHNSPISPATTRGNG